MNEKIEKLKKEYGDYAKKNGFNLNPNEKIVEGVLNGLIARKENFGERYCPCRKMTGIKKEDKRIICPCVYHKEEIEKDGHCFCNLFTR
ncbi:MAG TPA: ferredoxin-thioredoxin reductase catalytic domain-containing protein [Candidatus Paceibacterota bacterium]|nr:ferredoxin-thioredoxin reductase catalytic domain-containing protein [Candidatus Paceibacterota bacterium]